MSFRNPGGAVVAALLAAASSAAAQTPDAPPQAEQPQAEAGHATERVICKRTQRIGSRRIEKVCRTESQLRREEEAAREHLDRTRDMCLSADGRGAVCNAGGEPGRLP